MAKGVLKLIASENFISYNKFIAKEVGLEEAIVLGELCSVSNIFNDKEFYCRQEKICNDTCLTERAVRIALKHLEEKGILTITKKGCPCKNWYLINEEAIKSILENCGTSSVKNDTSSSVKSDTSSTVKSDTTVKEFKKRNDNKEFNNISDKPKSEHTIIFETYLGNYKKLYEEGIVETENPIVNYAQASKLINSLKKSIPVDSIIKILNNAVNDSWVIQQGYSICTILSSNCANKLLNAKIENTSGYKKTYSNKYETECMRHEETDNNFYEEGAF